MLALAIYPYSTELYLYAVRYLKASKVVTQWWEADLVVTQPVYEAVVRTQPASKNLSLY